MPLPSPPCSPVLLLSCLVALLLGASPAGAQETESCEPTLERAAAAYVHQEYGTTVTLVQDCLDRGGLSDEEAIEGYRLLGLVSVRQQVLREARAAITRILALDPGYTADPVDDPPSYALLVSMVRTLRASPSVRLAPARLPVAPLTRVTAPHGRGDGPALAPGPVPADGPTTVAARPPRARTHGLRLTHRTRGHEQVHGLTLTLWGPRAAPRTGHVTGLALGMPATGAARLHGIGVAPLEVVGPEALSGVALGGVGLRAGRLYGVGVGGVGSLVHDRLVGVAVNGGVLAGRGGATGLSVSGLGTALGGGGTGLLLSGGLLRTGGPMRGVALTGGVLVAGRVQGLAAAPVLVPAAGRGVFVAPLGLVGGGAGPLTGLTVSPLTIVRGRQTGLSVGLLNGARELHGVQIGLLNYAGNNPLLLRLLPGMNVHL
jgi:hypothetical protein